MRAVTVLAFALMIAAVTARKPTHPEDIPSYTFAEYVVDFKKPYAAGSDEYAKREALFESAKKVAMAHNACPKKSRNYKKAINDLSDKTPAEFKKRLGCKAIQHYSLLQKMKSSSPLVKEHVSSGLAVPDAVDWRGHVPSIFTGIKDQGDCGSCWAHASTENLESHWALRTGQLFTLSQQMITACAPNPNDCGGTGGCGGSTAELAYAYATTAGIAQEWTYPYTAYTGTTGTCSNSITTTDVKVAGYTAIASNNQDAVLDALAHVGPLAINVDASEWSNYGGGIYDGCGANVTIDHVVQLVGYGHDFGLGQDYWIVRNSWSPTWGENGFIRLIRHKTPTCGWDNQPSQGTGCNGGPDKVWTCGQCGILFDALYPNVVA